MAALPLHLAPGLRIATYLIVTAAVAWLYWGRARETGQTKAPAAAMALWLVFGIALLLAINGRSTGFLPVKVARALLVIAIPALRLSWLFRAACGGRYVRGARTFKAQKSRTSLTVFAACAGACQDM